MRSAFAGAVYVIRFNYPFYLLSFLTAVTCVISALWFSGVWTAALWAAAGISVYFAAASIGASHWIYDRSDLYNFNWVKGILPESPRIAVCHAGFDEVSPLLKARFSGAEVQSFDFLRVSGRTEASIVRARTLYAASDSSPHTPGGALPDNFDGIFLMLAAHELRTPGERILLLSGLRQSLRPGAVLIFVEHLRNLPNFLAFGPGAFHFWPRRSWEADFKAAGLEIAKKFAITPFLGGYFLK